MPKAGLYLHYPFCRRKCAYCDFYSGFPNEKTKSEYLKALTAEIKKWGGQFSRPIDSVYIGGGTPSLLGEDIIPLLSAARQSFNIDEASEITAEANPCSADSRFLAAAKAAEVNRLSIGIQSGIDGELKLLGRSHTVLQAAECVKRAREAGFDNISLDLMIGLPGSSVKTLGRSLEFLCSLEPEHISAYILKIEPNTAFFAKKIDPPCDDEVAEQYLYMCDYLRQRGFERYEISNFSKKSKESRHNLKYWQNAEYLGIGPSAHSYISGNRFFYPRDLKGFISAPSTVPDGSGGSPEEQLMLRLRLSSGIDISELSGSKSELEAALSALQRQGLITLSGGRLSLTDSGCLVSNSIISLLTELFYENL